jgi:hypothetical protein
MAVTARAVRFLCRRRGRRGHRHAWRRVGLDLLHAHRRDPVETEARYGEDHILLRAAVADRAVAVLEQIGDAVEHRRRSGTRVPAWYRSRAATSTVQSPER